MPGEAIVATFDAPPAAAWLRERAALFAVERAVARYERVMLGGSASQRRTLAYVEPARAGTL